MRGKIFEEINEIVLDWNPIEVPADLAKVEYKLYITRIIAAGNSYKGIKTELVNILTVDLGATYDENNLIQKHEVESVAKKILEKLLREDVTP